MITKAIHDMNLSEAKDKLKEYDNMLLLRTNQTKALNDIIESINQDTPDLKDCIRILYSRINELTPSQIVAISNREEITRTYEDN